MNNLLPNSIKIHEKYDLKGSTYKRKASDKEREKSSPTFKDLDFLDRYHLLERFSSSNINLAASKKEFFNNHHLHHDGDDDDYFGGLQLESHIYDDLIDTLQRDCRVLESFEIMDYSLLVGVHNYDRSLKELEKKNRKKSAGQDSPSGRKYIHFDYDNDDDLPYVVVLCQCRDFYV